MQPTERGRDRVRRQGRTGLISAVIAILAVLFTGLGAPAARAGLVPTSPPTPVPFAEVPTPFVDGAAGSYAWGAATMPDGSVIIGDIWNRRVLHYDTAGNLLGTLFTEPTSGDAPYGLAVDPRSGNGTIYVGRQFAAGVERWVLSGGVYSIAGTTLHAVGMQYPSRVAVADDGKVYVSDMLANKIFVFDGDTHQFLFSFGSRGSAPGQFLQPRALAFDANQLLYVMDSYNYRVEIFHADGTYVGKFGSKGSPFSGKNTRGLAVDRTNGWVFVVDIGAGTVDKFDLTGHFIQSIGQPSTADVPTPLGSFVQGGREDTIDGLGHLWVGDMPNFRVQVFDGATGNPLFMRPDPVQLPPTGAFNDPRGLTVDSVGNLYVADTHNFRIEKFNSAGQFVWAIGSRGRTQPDTFDYSRNLASDWTDDSFYVADTYNSAIDHYDKNGNLLWRVAASGAGPDQFAFPSGVGIGPNESVYVADSRNHRIQVLDHTTGAYVSQFDCAPCKDPRGVAVDPATGNIYVSDMNAALLEFDSYGKYVATLASKGTGAGQLSTASDVVLDSNYIYVADGGADEVKMFSLADGSYVTQFRGTRAARMRLPSAVAVDPSTGHLYVAEEYNDRVSSWCIAAC